MNRRPLLARLAILWIGVDLWDRIIVHPHRHLTLVLRRLLYRT